MRRLNDTNGEFEKIEPSVERKSRPVVLLIEDGHINIDEAAKIKGANVHIATNLEEAKAIAKERRPDYVISDVNFPTEWHGYSKNQALEVLRLCDKIKTPLVFVTGRYAIDVMSLGLEEIASSLEKNYVHEAFITWKMDKREHRTYSSDRKSEEIYRKALEMAIVIGGARDISAKGIPKVPAPGQELPKVQNKQQLKIKN